MKEKTGMKDPFNLQRFVQAQKPVYRRALEELRSGEKESHWMWFIFPQARGLGISSTAVFYGIKDAAEAKAYLEHPVLGPRLLECSQALLQVQGKTASDIFGFPDDVKLRSSMTLFALISPPGSVFEQVLAMYFKGELDPRTKSRLAR